MKKRRRKSFRRIRYVARKGRARRRGRKNPSLTTLGLLAGGGLLAYLLYKKWKAKQAALPAKPSITIGKSGAEITMPALDLRVGMSGTPRQYNMSGFGGVLGSGGMGSLS